MESGEQTRVLVVDDVEPNRELLCEVLELLGYVVESVESGEEAVRRVAQRHYAVVLMDCQMPIMDGFQATMEIRRLEGSARRTPILAVTAYGLDARERALAAGMDELIAKPIDLADLERELARWSRAGAAPMGACAAVLAS